MNLMIHVNAARRNSQLFGLAMILALLTSGALAAQNAPNSLGQPLLDSAGDVRDDAFIRIPLRADDQKYADIDGDRLKSFLMEVDAISLADRDRGNVFWGRNIGTLGHEETQDWVERYFRANGLENVYRQPFDVGPQWKPEAWMISFSAGGRTFELESARPPQGAESTPAGGPDFELVWLGTGSEADYIGRDVRGKAVLILDIPRPGTLRHSIRTEGLVARAFEHGAAAVGIVYGISDNFAVWQRTAGRPGFNLGYRDGLMLRDLLGEGERVTVNLQMRSEVVSGLQASSGL